MRGDPEIIKCCTHYLDTNGNVIEADQVELSNVIKKFQSKNLHVTVLAFKDLK